MMDEFLVIILLGALAWFWYNSVQIREIAAMAAKIRCESRGLLLLDQTVFLHKIRLRRDVTGQMRFEREYQFEYSVDGDDRYKGIITLLGKRIDHCEIDQPMKNIIK